jgi:hypothetical protein
MPRDSDAVELSRAERLRDSKRKPTSMTLPLAIHHRLDVLAEAAQDVDATRAELIAMLIAEAEPNPEILERAVLRYRKLQVGDVIPEHPEPLDVTDTKDEDNVVSILPRGPGRPAKRRETRA